jgi:hypothetical protein
MIGGLLGLYMLWPLTVSIRHVHRMNTLKAVLAWLVPGIVLSIIAVIIGAAITAMMAASGVPQGTGAVG